MDVPGQLNLFNEAETEQDMTLLEEESCIRKHIRRELVYVPARCEVNEYYSQNYGCPNCKEGNGDTETAVIIKFKAPEVLVGK